MENEGNCVKANGQEMWHDTHWVTNEGCHAGNGWQGWEKMMFQYNHKGYMLVLVYGKNHKPGILATVQATFWQYLDKNLTPEWTKLST